MYIDRCGRRHRIHRQGLIATLLVKRIRRLQLLHQSLFHPKNAADHPRSVRRADALKTGKWPAEQDGVALVTAASGAAARQPGAPPTPAPGGESPDYLSFSAMLRCSFRWGSVFPAQSFNAALSPALAYASNNATASRCAFT
jgi:hypothetical protein